MIRLLLVDDQRTIRASLLSMLKSAPDIQVVGTANDGAMALEQVEILQPDVVLIDMEMPGMDGLAATQSICDQFPDTKVLVLSCHDSNKYILKALQAGAMGYLLKNTPAHQLQESVRFVHLGYAQFGPGVIEKVVPLQTPSPTQTVHPAPSPQPQRQSIRNDYHAPIEPDVMNPPVGYKPSQSSWAFGLGLANLPSPLDSIEGQHAPYPMRPMSTHPTLSAQTVPAVVKPKLHYAWYAAFGLLLNLLLWGGGLAWLQLSKQVYSSQWTVSLPSASTSTNVSLPGVGEARSDSSSPYQSSISDPRENYKFLMGSDAVLERAAKTLKMPKNQLDSPDVKILTNTTLLQFTVSAPTAQDANQRAIAFKEAFANRIQELREAEVDQQDGSLQKAYEEAKQKLDLTQRQLADFKSRSGLGSNDQIQELNSNIEVLRRQKAESVAQIAELEANSQQLSQSVNLSPQQAAEAVELQANPLFQQLLTNYKTANSELVKLTSEFSPSHPLVLQQQEKFQKYQSQLMSQGQTLLDRPITLSELTQLAIENTAGNSEQATLFQQMIRLQGEQRGLKAEVQGLNKQIQQLEARLADLTQKGARLKSLERDAQRAEAVYSSTATKLDLSHATISASYPAITDVTDPDLPPEPSSPNIKLSLLGMILASTILSLGFLLLMLKGRRQRIRALASAAS